MIPRFLRVGERTMTTLGMWGNYPMSNSILGRYCPNCDHTYFSRARHDMNCCPCWISSERKTGGFVDGGREYLRVGGQGIVVRIFIEQTNEELAEDWRTGANKYGLIKGNVGSPIDDPL